MNEEPNPNTRVSTDRAQPCTTTKQYNLIRKRSNPLKLRAGTNRNRLDLTKLTRSKNNKQILQNGEEQTKPRQQCPKGRPPQQPPGGRSPGASSEETPCELGSRLWKEIQRTTRKKRRRVHPSPCGVDEEDE